MNIIGMKVKDYLKLPHIYRVYKRFNEIYPICENELTEDDFERIITYIYIDKNINQRVLVIAKEGEDVI